MTKLRTKGGDVYFGYMFRKTGEDEYTFYAFNRPARLFKSSEIDTVTENGTIIFSNKFINNEKNQ